jgi:hypothetical protein
MLACYGCRLPRRRRSTPRETYASIAGKVPRETFLGAKRANLLFARLRVGRVRRAGLGRIGAGGVGGAAVEAIGDGVIKKTRAVRQ